MPRLRRSDLFRELLRTLLPENVRHNEQAAEESIQTGVWLVGLAAALLALLVANLDKLTFLSPTQSNVVVGLLALAIVAGEIQRVLYLMARGREVVARTLLLAGLWGRESADTDPRELAEPLDQQWDEEEIARRLREQYELEVSSLLQLPDALSVLRERYSRRYVVSEALDRDELRSLLADVGAYAGWDDRTLERQLAEAEGEVAPKKPRIHHK